LPASGVPKSDGEARAPWLVTGGAREQGLARSQALLHCRSAMSARPGVEGTSTRLLVLTILRQRLRSPDPPLDERLPRLPVSLSPEREEPERDVVERSLPPALFVEPRLLSLDCFPPEFLLAIFRPPS